MSGEYETKLYIQKLLFPKGIVINPEDRTYRTSNLNPIFGLIHSFTGGNDDENKKRTSSNTDPSLVVDILEKRSKVNRMDEPNQIE